PGNPLLYGTTKYFLQYFGLKDISDLPKLREIDDLLKNDQDFLESMDQVSLEQLKSEELGLKYMEAPDSDKNDKSDAETKDPAAEASQDSEDNQTGETQSNNQTKDDG
ncbi:MAG: hypothetical protein GF313_11305, partial [Caldithrix sp.]|nr:hypothetical protein [Caldithrix sp.]